VQAGDVLRQRDLAGSFRRIAAEGAGALYDGSLGEAVVREMERRGGLITRQDLAACPASLAWSEPISIDYRGVRVYTSPPPTSAFTLLASLAIAAGWPLGDMEHLGPDHLLILAESLRAARMDTERWAGDPDFVSVPVDELLSPGHIAELRARVEDRLRTGGGGAAPAPGPVKSSTTHLAALDASGLGINMTHSMGWGFGCGVVVEGTGIPLNHSLHWGRLEPGHNNELRPGKRHEWPIAPAQIFRDGRLWALVGTPGNYGILATTAQVISAISLDGRHHRFAPTRPAGRRDPLPGRHPRGAGGARVRHRVGRRLDLARRRDAGRGGRPGQRLAERGRRSAAKWLRPGLVTGTLLMPSRGESR